MEVQPYVLVELEDFSPLSSPVKSSQRIKYTCFDASQRFVVLGATSGGIYIFQRKPCLFLQLIPNTEGAITKVSVSPNESMFAFSTVKGFVFLVDHNIGQDASGGVRKVQVSSDHRGAQVTAFQWHQKTNDLYIGDDRGKVSVVSVSFFMAKTIFQAPSFTLMELDSKIVQMDIHGNYLLVSTLTRSYICDTAQEQYRKIGSKPRNGIFGACFQDVNSCNSLAFDSSPSADGSADRNLEVQNTEAINVRIFCARPGARLWEVGISGDVVSTHKFSEVLAVPPIPILLVNPQPEPQEKSIVPGFTKLFPIGERFIFSYEQQSVYIMDPENACVILWSRLHQEATDVRIIGNVAYLWSGSLLALTLLTVEECLVSLFSANRLKTCINLCLHHLQYLMRHAQHILPLADLGMRVTSMPEEMVPLMEEVSRLAKKQEGRSHPPVNVFKRLESGMHVSGVREPGERVYLRGIRGGVAVVRSRSASPRFQLRKTGNRTHASAKTDLHHEGDPESTVAKDCPSSSLPDLSESGCDRIDRELSFSPAESNDDQVDQEKESKQSEPVQSHMNSIGAISQKLVESTITIREKWQELGGLVRAFSRDSPIEALDTDKCEENYDEKEENGGSDEGVYVYEDEIILSTRNRLLAKNMSSPADNKLPETKQFHPVLNLERVFEILKEITSEGYEIPTLHALFDSMFEVFLSYSFEKNNDSLVIKNGGDNVEGVSATFEEPKSETLSFPFRYYFTESMIAVILNSLEVLLSSSGSSVWLEEKFSSSLIKREDIHPALRSACSQQEIMDDIYFCALLDPFLDLIDALRILSFLGISSSPCRFLTWCKLVELVIHRPWERLKKPNDNSLENGHLSNIPATFPFLLTEFHKVRETNCSILLKEAPQILMKEGVSLRHCLYITFWLCSDNNSEDWCSTLLSILLLSECDIGQDNICRSCAIDALDKLNSIVSSKALCLCGYPHIGVISSCTHSYASVVVRLSKYFWQAGDHEESLKLCWNSGLWRWFIWFLHVQFQKGDGIGKEVLSPLRWDKSRGCWEWGILSLLATLGDRWCLEEWLEDMDEAAWRKFVDLRMEVLRGQCLGCKALGHPLDSHGGGELVPSGIAWTDVGVLMIERLGPATACTILMECCSLNGSGQLDASFYQLSILSTVVSSVAQDKTSMQLMMRKLLRQESRKVFSPQVSQMVEECLARDSHSWGDVECLIPLPPSRERAADHHWGRSLTVSKDIPCPRCSLPLTSQVLLSSNPGGLLVLSCGHTLHAVCARFLNKSCPLGCSQVRLGSGGASMEEI
ncbi:BLOC-2 complex member HPS5 [Hetaerina americana]|uniref:BLOC-2 complex member HPS5 n=1 Tax=Hetaerina americana TaxID=62018 RepID=UPI003A7F319B